MRERPDDGEAGRREAGTSLIEVLIALFIMLLLTLGILQMFSMAYMLNLGSAARTQMTFKCEQVTENLRLVGGIVRAGGTVPFGSGISLAAGSYDLPHQGSEADYAYWGPAGANVVEGPHEPYRLSYDMVDEDISGDGVPDCLRVTVTAVPNDDTSAQRYIGAGIPGKRVTYVSRIPL